MLVRIKQNSEDLIVRALRRAIPRPTSGRCGARCCGPLPLEAPPQDYAAEKWVESVPVSVVSGAFAVGSDSKTVE